MMEIGDIGRATPEDDDYDGQLVRIVNIISGEASFRAEYDVELLEGDRKGNIVGPWAISTVIPISPLERLARATLDEE